MGHVRYGTFVIANAMGQDPLIDLNLGMKNVFSKFFFYNRKFWVGRNFILLGEEHQYNLSYRYTYVYILSYISMIKLTYISYIMSITYPIICLWPILYYVYTGS